MKSELICSTSLSSENGQVSSAAEQVESFLEPSDNIGGRLGLYFPRNRRDLITCNAGDHIFNYWCVLAFPRVFLACE